MAIGITKRVRQSVTDAAAQTVIAMVITIGFVAITILSGLGYFVPDMYNAIMGYYGPFEAIVLGFYFGVNITRPTVNGPVTPVVDVVLDQKVTQLTDDVAKLTAVVTTLVELQKGST